MSKQHIFEFIAEMKDGGHYRMNYKGKTSRKSKVVAKIQEDLKKMYNVNPLDIANVYLKPVDK